MLRLAAALLLGAALPAHAATIEFSDGTGDQVVTIQLETRRREVDRLARPSPRPPAAAC